jgi:hypothetical protein
MFLIAHVLTGVSTAALATGTYDATGMALLMFMGLTRTCASVFAVFYTAFMSITSDICSRNLLQAKLSIVYSSLNKCLCNEGSPINIDLILRSGDCPPLKSKDHDKRPTSPLAVPDTVLRGTLLCCT